MLTIFRYRTMKPRDGKLEFTYHRGGTIIGFTEHWHTERGWESVIDVIVDTDVPVERRRFFLCTAGDRLDALGENAFAYHVATHQAKGYRSYLFDVSHLSDTDMERLGADEERLARGKPEPDEMGRTARAIEERAKTDRQRSADRERRDRANAQAREDRLRRMREAGELLVQAREGADKERALIELESRAAAGDSEAEAVLNTLAKEQPAEEAVEEVVEEAVEETKVGLLGRLGRVR